jgi:hypothetical protein
LTPDEYTKFKIAGRWQTWIDYKHFQEAYPVICKQRWRKILQSKGLCSLNSSWVVFNAEKGFHFRSPRFHNKKIKGYLWALRLTEFKILRNQYFGPRVF